MPPLRRKRGITLRNDNQERYSSFTPGFYGFETPAPATPKRRFGFGTLTACAVLFLILGLIGGAVLMRLTSLDHYYGQYAEAAGDQEEGDLPAGTPQPEGPEDRPAVTVQPDPLPEREELPVPALGSDTLPNIGEENRARDIADQVGPSVVSVTAGWVYESQVTGKEIREDVSAGSGIVLTADGYIVTNEHIIAGCDYYCATVGGVDYDAVLLGSDAQADIAVLKIEAEGLTSAAIGDSSLVRAGDYAAAIGNSLGTLSGSITQGIISGLDRQVNIDGRIHTYLQTDAAVNPGSSGGALVNAQGQVIGICNSKQVIASYDEYGNPIYAEGVGYAIPINDAMEVVKGLIQYGYVPRPAIGIRAYEMTQTDAEEWQLPKGMLVTSVTETAPAYGLVLPEDVILGADGEALASMNDLTSLIQEKGVGETVRLTIWRSGEELEVTVTIGDQNQIDAAQEEYLAGLYGYEEEQPVG